MSSDEPKTGDGQSASTNISFMRGQARLITFLVLLGSTAYAARLVTTVPASLVVSRARLPDQVIDISGTLWNGQAILAGGYELNWKVLPIHSLFHVAFDADWTLEGSDTKLMGRSSLWSESAASSVDGRLGWGLVRIAIPGLAVSCDGSLAIALSRVMISASRQGAVGSLRSGPMICTDASADPAVPIELPPLIGTATMGAETAKLTVAASSSPQTPLADFKVAGHILAATLHPEGARLAKSLPTSAPIVIEYSF